MTIEDEEQFERNLAEHENVQKYVRSRLERAERAYGQALTSLWIGNAGAALATLTFIGSAWQKGAFPRPLLLPLCLFVLGLIFMGLGAAISLTKEGVVLSEMQRATSFLDLKFKHIKTSAEEAGLTWDWRTGMALSSAACFVVGCLVGLSLLFSFSR